MDYYALLGVSTSASTREIKQAYRKKALQCHPDLHPQAGKELQEEFVLAKEAYEVLSQPKRRQAYDIVRGLGRQAAEGPRSRWGTRHEEPFDEDFREFWEKFGHRFTQEEEKRRASEYQHHADRAAAWEAEKKEAAKNKERYYYKRSRVREARHARVATVLSSFWHSHPGVTWQDAMVACLVVVAAGGIAYTWRPAFRRSVEVECGSSNQREQSIGHLESQMDKEQPGPLRMQADQGFARIEAMADGKGGNVADGSEEFSR